MNWDAVGAIGELIGAAAVVVTLMFLVKEMRMNRLAAESNTIDSLAGGLNEVNLQVASDPEMADIWTRGFADPATLSETECVRFALIGQALVNQFTAIKKHFDSGTLSIVEWDAYCSATCQLMSGPGGTWLMENVVISPEIFKVLRETPHEDYVSPHHWPDKRVKNIGPVT